ncbi:hypothetical protein NECAME_17581 [Necator americanus]|uniref:Uncharacterized protein n=1 Tax=Necator americanus TaxID=51031 RepID=W2TPN4_NECAM|nr:hypothetical protein NECAME_17581 [Necator americanus]ETN83096.1 hypothetical protein NECAME_17581 [Necator americanus]
MPRTAEIMNRLGYEFLCGYIKVGDDSMVNLEPVLAGDIPEALNESIYDNSSDIICEWILPTNKNLGATPLPFLLKTMKESNWAAAVFMGEWFGNGRSCSYEGIEDRFSGLKGFLDCQYTSIGLPSLAIHIV